VFKPLGAQQRFTALQSGEVDVLSRNTTWTYSRDTTLGLSFVGTLLYDGQGFIVPKELEVDAIADLDGASICVQSGTTTELNLTDYFRARGLSFKPVVFEGFDESTAAFFAGRCDAYTTDVSALAVIRATHTTKANDYIILDETISKEPFAPAVRQDDPVWFAINRWVLGALIEAEELGLTRATVADERATTTSPAIRRMLGVDAGLGEGLGLSDDWVFRVIRHVGNYGEVFERTLGMNSPLQLDRGFNQGLNRLWKDGGVHYTAPIR
jgi:general L-amino acid transport system substrate-binding protein